MEGQIPKPVWLVGWLVVTLPRVHLFEAAEPQHSGLGASQLYVRNLILLFDDTVTSRNH